MSTNDERHKMSPDQIQRWILSHVEYWASLPEGRRSELGKAMLAELETNSPELRCEDGWEPTPDEENQMINLFVNVKHGYQDTGGLPDSMYLARYVLHREHKAVERAVAEARAKWDEDLYTSKKTQSEDDVEIPKKDTVWISYGVPTNVKINEIPEDSICICRSSGNGVVELLGWIERNSIGTTEVEKKPFEALGHLFHLQGTRTEPFEAQHCERCGDSWTSASMIQRCAGSVSDDEPTNAEVEKVALLLANAAYPGQLPMNEALELIPESAAERERLRAREALRLQKEAVERARSSWIGYREQLREDRETLRLELDNAVVFIKTLQAERDAALERANDLGMQLGHAGVFKVDTERSEPLVELVQQEKKMSKEAVPTSFYKKARELAIEVLKDQRIQVLCPHCHGTSARAIMEDGIIVGIRCSDSCGGVIFGRESHDHDKS